MSDKYIHTKKIFDAETVTAGASSTTDAMDMNEYMPEGYFSLQVTLTGDGTGKFTFETSNDGVDYHTPTDSTDIVTAHTKTSGPGSDGKDSYLIDTEFTFRYLKIKVEETGSSNSIVVTATIAIN